MATTNEENNNTLYFIVGGLVVLALIFGFIYMSNGMPSERMAANENAAVTPAAGTTNVEVHTDSVTPAESAPAPSDSGAATSTTSTTLFVPGGSTTTVKP